MALPPPLTMVTENEEATPAEVTVELDEDLIGRAVHRLQRRVPAELTNLRRALVRSVPVEIGR